VEFAPVAITQVNWPSYDEMCRNSLGYAPIKEIDGSQFNLNDPAAFLSTLKFDDPLRTLREGEHPNFAHFFVTFAGVVFDYDLITLIGATGLIATSRPMRRNKYFVLLTGNVNLWRKFAIEHSVSGSELRLIANQVYIRFKQAGFRELFDGYQSHKLSDGSFILKCQRGK
jgi:hypothetical protein